MDGFTITCRNCQTKSEFKKENERVTEIIKIMIHGLTEVCIYCDKCEKRLKLQ